MKKILIIFLLANFQMGYTTAQQESTIKRSEIIEKIEGKSYYLHFVKQGETLAQIAKAYNVLSDEITRINPEAKNGITPNKIIKIPCSETEQNNKSQDYTAKDFFQYSVKSKETLYGISKKFGVGIELIRNLNPEIGVSLREGQIIKIPGKPQPDQNPEQKPAGNTITHTVKAGETVFGIAKMYGISVSNIEKANPGSGSQIKVGEQILIPVHGTVPNQKETPQKKNDPFKKHTVVAGETIFSIAKKYSMDVDSIVKYNPGLTQNIQIGQILLIPESPDKDYIFHKADKNEKLQNIADKYGVSYDALLKANPGIQKKIEKGQIIKVPVRSSEPENLVKTDEKPEIENSSEKNCGNSDKHKHSTFKIALMLPLNLELVDSLVVDSLTNPKEISEMSPMKFIQFYEGFKIAVDSMNKAGMNLDLYVFDVNNTQTKISAALSSPGMEKMDLIVGLLYSEGFGKVAEFARENKIKIVNPLSTREEILMSNPFVFKVKPPVTSQTDVIAPFILKHYAKSNIVIIRQNRYKYQEETSFIKNYLNNHRTTGTYLKNSVIIENLHKRKLEKVFSDNNLFSMERLSARFNDSTYISNIITEVVYADDSAFHLKLNLSSVRNNLVIALSDDKVFCQLMMSQMNKLAENYDISLFGGPDWEKFGDLETDFLTNLNVHWLTPALVDFENPAIKQWIQSFRNNYHTEPSIEKYAFDGFDIGWYFLNALYRYGDHFEDCLDDYHIKLIQTSFDFEQLKGNGFENQYWNVGMHKDFRFIRAGN